MKPLALFALLAGISAAGAQSIAQVSVGNYSKTNSVYLNPAMPAGSKLRWQMHLGGFWLNANNNYLRLKVPYSLYRLPGNVPYRYRTESGNPQFRKEWLVENINGRNKQLSASSEVHGPALSMAYRAWNFGFFTQASAAVRVNDFPEPLAHALFRELDSGAGAFALFRQSESTAQDIQFSAAGNSRLAAGINMARSFRMDRNARLLLGASIKRVYGMQGFYMRGTSLSVLDMSGDSLRITPGQVQLIQYRNNDGRGYGADLGATLFLHRKSSRRNGNYAKNHSDYFAKIGISLLDLGRLRYRNAAYSTYRFRDTVLAYSNLRTDGNMAYVADSLLTDFSTLEKREGHLLLGLPSRLSLSADMQFRKHIYMSAVLVQSLRKRNSVHARAQSFLMLAPRLEYRYFEFSMPLLLEYDYRAFRLGASFRIGPLFFGSNSLLAFLHTRSVADADVFAGISVSDLLFLKSGRISDRTKAKRGGGGLSCAEF